ncbi:MAG: TIGR04211 family SH3 domain-containing protein [Desulfobacterales bacterium]|jgi:SH3 domain protein|nr:MAG: TIGR04211 family SH3 domain-containing protein [Desulfobacterales bacterium]
MKLLNVLIGLIGFFFLVFSGIVYAETMYVTDVLRLTLRTGQSTDYKIIAVIESGQEVEVLQPGEEWSSVRLSNGKEGWVLTRYLTPNETNNIKLERLEQKHKNLMAQAAVLLEENTKLKNESQKLGQALAENEKTLNKTQSDFESLKTDSAEFINLRKKYEKTSKQLAEKSLRLAELEDQISKLTLYHIMKWFLLGAGVMLVGFIAGFGAKRQRRRPSLL